ncbi:hypothetical protein BH780_gp237 [Bacillus phage Eldridge]|uniref:Uncharacterized protein n=1 Tax=Bacillus phage Eldridge TaxID=1776293 RepID=A0A109QIW1_9CAUD|nr:hypothetical protein BH780_gp007 [Bacillus phage Eldridge]YP_009274944.1 hypothetical protein BH780_gp237 [Bacillus phage Eldridge]AMB18818.1 hypothetical protein Eldridge_07 [Bacillus phage Eldridge]AMB18822.1 hypothetical protein Eldridge_0240 [Bacillus phage Eldridge]
MRYYVITGIEDEYGFIMEEVVGVVREGEVMLDNPLGRYPMPEAYSLEDVIELDEITYNRIMKMHIDTAETGWGDEEEDELQAILKDLMKEGEC